MKEGEGVNHEIKEKDNQKKNKFTEDTANDIIDIEFRELQDWTKTQIRKLKMDCYDHIELLKLKADKK
jgi:hypothetical protein